MMEFIGVSCENGSRKEINIFDSGIITTTLVLGTIDLVVILGNSLVIAAVISTRKLRTVTNMHIISLACADLMLGFAVLPFSISLEVVDIWLWGNTWCSMWLAIDVLLCTASILSLCAISLDRYIAVTHPIRYPRIITPRRGKIIVTCVWILSLVICLPPLLGWNDSNVHSEEDSTGSIVQENASIYVFDIFESVTSRFTYTNTSFVKEMNINHSAFRFTRTCKLHVPKCELTPTTGYRIYASLGSFYLPMFVMVFFYCKIYSTAVKTSAALRTGVLTTKASNELNHNEDCISLRVHRGGSTNSAHALAHSEERDRKFVPFTQIDQNGVVSLGLKSKTGYCPKRECHIINKEVKRVTSDRNCRSRFIQPFNIKWKTVRKAKTNADYQNVKRDKLLQVPVGQDIETSTLEEAEFDQTDDVARKVGNKTISITRRCRLMLTESKSVVSSKGHARKFKRETKAAKTVAIIVGAFIVCWLPFFTIYLIGAFCHDCVSELVFSIFFWLGYCNSALNPCIYALFARDFRFAFKRLLICRHQRRLNRMARTDIILGTRKMRNSPVLESDSISDF
ncbi:hypothetical protein CHS0354_041088 [Potamilus streckersoni]|uniref:G-protein coupled receptors family 1 profile domain-containing protein n=1 Tax=Potamilus streckersoni TaxID=2493646 RepID=A0AAE0SE82_9BIVA|nr:hypothetical protein CHS0354_041088 [Potamilus streckersoni]